MGLGEEELSIEIFLCTGIDSLGKIDEMVAGKWRRRKRKAGCRAIGFFFARRFAERIIPKEILRGNYINQVFKVPKFKIQG